MKTEPNKFSTTGAPYNTRPCPACGAMALTHSSDYPSNVKPFSKRTILYCTECGLGHVPDAAEMLDAFYREDYARTNRKDREIDPETYFSEAHRENSRMMHRYYARARGQIIRLRKHGARFEHVLDFGSGPGYFLHLCEATAPCAFEPDLASAKYLDHLGARQFATLDDIPQDQFDVIVASHSIEHLAAEELTDTLSHLVGALNATGLMLIEVPQGGHSYLHLDGVRQDPHTLFFTPQALVEAVKRVHGEIVFAGAVAKPEIPRRETPIYTPEGAAFNKVNRGGLTVICRRPQAPE
ncbi:methyltransferase domain-containing protein [uncultured Roseovarius sp.]|uniref:class I SAM-dependent methyltransferase n=1 Tax=uncultured Roseovarius sp. TaxID=293344 RepID=UPI00260CC20B|nr:methyltransferase domain-containing protein [uncultured Roseovarius sp.]